MQRSAIDRTRTWNDMTSMYRTDPSGKTEVTGLGVGVKLAHDALPKYAMVRIAAVLLRALPYLPQLCVRA